MDTPRAPLSPPAPAPAPRGRRWLSPENPYLVPAFITLILASAHMSYGVLESLGKTLIAIAVAIAIELSLGRIVLGKWIHPASAYITGISVGILLRSPAVWPYVVCSALSILSKYVLRYKGRHLWNPSNFGVSAMLLLAGESVGSLSIQWGNHVWAMLVIWVIGAFIIWRLRRFHITATYVVAFIAFALLRSWATGSAWQSEIAPITGPMYQLFIFFMITDPRTTVSSKSGQCVVVLCVAALESLLRAFQVVYAPYYALFVVGPTALLVEMWLRERRAAAQRPMGVVK